MRRIRHLDQYDYIVPIGLKSSQVLALSNQSNVLLERPWHKDRSAEFKLLLHAKFNSDDMNGLQIISYLSKNNQPSMSVNPVFRLYRCDDDTWQETLVVSANGTTTNGVHKVEFDQDDLGLNELSGRETYAIECDVDRKRNKFKARAWFNHLGCYDHLLVLRRAVERFEATKVDM